jgi:hypothetical protein
MNERIQQLAPEERVKAQFEQHDKQFKTANSTAYERGFIDGMQKQMQSSVDKAVNAMAQRIWVGLTDEDMKDHRSHNFDFIRGARWAEAKLKEKNT